MTSKYSVAIIGLGKIGLSFDYKLENEYVLSHTRALTLHDSFELLYGVDPSKVMRERFESLTGKTAYSCLKEIPRKKLDIVVVAVPTKYHLETVASLREFNPKLIVVEKPCGSTLSEAREIKKMADSIGSSVFVNYMRRCDPAVLYVKDQISKKSFGEVIGGNVLYSKGLSHNGSHYLSLILDFFGRPSSVAALRIKENGNLDFSLDWKRFGVTFLSGVEEKASLGEIDLIFENARVRFEQYGEILSFFEAKNDPVYEGYKRFEPSKFKISPDLGRYQLHVYDYIDSIMKKLPDNSSLEHALKVHEIIEKLLLSDSSKVHTQI